MTKPYFIVTDMNHSAIGADGMVREMRSEAAAVKKAKDLLIQTSGNEVWVWKLSHIVSVGEPDVDTVK